MAVNLETLLDEILYDKKKNAKPEDIRYGSTILGVKGTLRPVTVEGGDTGTLIYTQRETPIKFDGLWLNTDKTYDYIYIEPERYTNAHSWMVSDDPTDSDDDDTNIIKGIKSPANLEGATYVQRGNMVHFFGRRCRGVAEANEPVENSHQHYMYNFDTNTWTKLVDTPTPQGMGGAVWVGDFIYILGSVYNTYHNHCYKYDTINDTYERLPDITPYGEYHPIVADLGEGNTIYFARAFWICKYNLDDYSTDKIYAGSYYFTIHYSSPANTFSYGMFKYVDGILYSGRSNSAGASDIKRYIASYNISTNAYNNTYLDCSVNSTTPVLCDGMNIYVGDNLTTSDSGSTNFRIYNLFTKAYVNAASTNAYNKTMLYGRVPVCIFTAKPYNIFCCIGNMGRTTAMTLNSKEYDFDANTLVVYAAQNGSGKYRTKLYENNKMLNDYKLYTCFDDVDLFEKGETENTLIKNIPTYYGNGSDWIQIK